MGLEQPFIVKAASHPSRYENIEIVHNPELPNQNATCPCVPPVPETGQLSLPGSSVAEKSASRSTPGFPTAISQQESPSGSGDQPGPESFVSFREPRCGGSSKRDFTMAVDSPAAQAHAISNIGRLPDELSIEIVRLLDAKPPSQLKIIDEPSVELTCSTSRPLKALSCVSRKWRQLVLPVLFKYARLTLDIDEVESKAFTYLGNKKYYRGLLFSLAAVRNFRDFFRREQLGNWEKCSLDILRPFPVDGALPKRPPMQPPFPGIESLVIHSPVQIPEPELRIYNTRASLFNVVSIWQALFDIANPLSLTILAHPNILAFLLGVEPSSGRGNSFDMPLHIFNCTLLPSYRDGLFHHFLQVVTKGYEYSSGCILEVRMSHPTALPVLVLTTFRS